MPFTTSHPAAVLPLKKLWPGWFSLTGLMAGAMAPDLQYFMIADTTHRGLSHSWLGLFTVCLPLGLIFSFVFHRLFKYDFIVNLPRPLDHKLSGLAVSRFAPGSAREWIILVVSILIGALSHFAWDSFTHFHGEMAQKIPFLAHQTTILGITRHNSRWLQHISSLAGGIIVLVYTWRWRLVPSPVTEESVRKPGDKILFWAGALTIGALAAVGALWFYDHLYNWHVLAGYNRTLAIITLGTASWGGTFYAICGYGVAKRFFARRAEAQTFSAK